LIYIEVNVYFWPCSLM